MFTAFRFFRILVILFLALPLALGSAHTPARAQEELVWEWHNPLPQGNDLEDVWGSGPDDVYAAGWGALLHYDGNDWSVLRDDGAYFDIWGSSANDVFVVGNDGVLHYDGVQWSSMPSTRRGLEGVWGFGPDDVFVAGLDGSLMHYDGATWTEIYDDPSSSTSFFAIWGSHANNLYIAGSKDDKGQIWRWDGASLIPVYTGARWRYYWSVWGTGPDDVFVGGDRGAVVHYDGHAWSQKKMGTADFDDLWGFAGDDVFAATDDGVFHYDGQQWSLIHETTLNMSGIWGPTTNELFVVGNSGMILHYKGGSWRDMTYRVTENSLDDVWGAAGNDIFAVGSRGVILHYDGSAWRPMVSHTKKNISAVWGNSGQDVFAVTWAPYGQESSILHYDGNDWQVVDSGVKRTLTGVWGSAPNNVFAVGDRGVILHYDGQTWSQMHSGVTDDLTAVWGSGPNNIYVAIDDGDLLHYDGQAWTRVHLQGAKHLHAIWGSGPDNIYLAGRPMFHFDGVTWQRVEELTTWRNYTYWDVWGTSSTDVYTVNTDERFAHFDGEQWRWIPTPLDYSTSLWHLWNSAPDDLFIVGSLGAIKHYGHPTQFMPMRLYLPLYVRQ